MMNCLPYDIYTYLTPFLGYKEICRLRRCNRRLNEIFSKENVWRILYERDLSQVIPPYGGRFYLVYKDFVSYKKERTEFESCLYAAGYGYEKYIAHSADIFKHRYANDIINRIVREGYIHILRIPFVLSVFKTCNILQIIYEITHKPVDMALFLLEQQDLSAEYVTSLLTHLYALGECSLIDILLARGANITEECALMVAKANRVDLFPVVSAQYFKVNTFIYCIDSAHPDFVKHLLEHMQSFPVVKRVQVSLFAMRRALGIQNFSLFTKILDLIEPVLMDVQDHDRLLYEVLYESHLVQDFELYQRFSQYVPNINYHRLLKNAVETTNYKTIRYFLDKCDPPK